jgi:hypothetical protein
MFGIAAGHQGKVWSLAREAVMTRSNKYEIEEPIRAAIAEDRIHAYLHKNHRNNDAAIAMRAMHRLALIWKIEKECRLIRNPDDPTLVFNMSNKYVHRVHSHAALLPPASQSDALAEHYITTVLFEFEPSRAWLTAHNIYNALALPRYPLISH